jgi:plastocyanin
MTVTERPELLARTGIALIAAVSFLTACGAERSGDVSSGPGGADAVTVAAVDNAFEPARLQLTAGEEIELEVTNEGETTHDLTIEALELSTGGLEPGGVATATISVPKGETTFRCTVHGGMEGTIVGH